MSLKKAFLSAAIVAALAGCGGGGDSSPSNTNSSGNVGKPTTPDTGENTVKASIGTFTDSAVFNIAYVSRDQSGNVTASGFTNERGEFEYYANNTVSFLLGKVVLGTVLAKKDVTPVDFPSPLKVAQILQSVDMDGNPDLDGIQIPESLHDSDSVVNTSLIGFNTLNPSDFETKVQSILDTLNGSTEGITYTFVNADSAQTHLDKNPVIQAKGGFQDMMLKRLIDTPEELSDGAVFSALSKVEGIENLQDDKPYQFAITTKEDELDVVETNRKIQLINQFEVQALDFATLRTPEGLQAFYETLSVLSGLDASYFVQQSYRYIKFGFENGSRTVDIVKTLYRARAMAKVEATLHSGENHSLEGIQSDLDKAEFPLKTVMNLYPLENKVRDQEYLLGNALNAESPSTLTMQAIVDATNTLASYARSYVKWPLQSRFPDSVILQTELTIDELQALVVKAGFEIEEKTVNGAIIDHKPDLVLDANNNTLNVNLTQLNINSTRSPGIASVGVQSNTLNDDNHRHAVIKNDGSVLSWRIDGSLTRSFETGVRQIPIVRSFNKANQSNPVTQVFTNSSYFAAIRQDGSVISWDTRLENETANYFASLNGHVKAIDIVSTSNAFAVLKEDGSIEVIGHGKETDTTSVSQDIALSNGQRFVSISATKKSFAALRNDGAIVSWGNISDEDLTKIKLELPGEDPQRPQDSANQAAIQIVANQGAFAAIKKDGSVFTWGDVGSGSDSSKVISELNGSSPVVRLVAAKGAFAALRKDGKVIAWGSKTGGGVLKASVSDYPDWMYADKENNIFANWLYESYGDGNGNIDFDKVHSELIYVGATMPEDPTELEKGVTALYANHEGFTAIKENGKHQTWGYEANMTAEEKQSIVATDITRVWASDRIYVAEKTDGSIVTWGRSFSTERGHTLFPADKLDGTIKVKNVKIALGSVAVLMEDGSVIQWGTVGFEITPNYQIGNTPTPRIQVDRARFDGSNPIVELSTTENSFIALHEDGSVTTWGRSWAGGNSEFLQRELGAQNTNVAYPVTDADNDGLDSQQERALGTSPNVRDSDSDGISDGVEVNSMGTQPLNDYSKPFESVNGVLKPMPEDRLMMNPQTGSPASWN